MSEATAPPTQEVLNGAPPESQPPQNAAPPNGEKTVPAQEAPEKPQDETLVLWDGPKDPLKPMNFPEWKKWLMVLTSGFMTFSVSFGSSVFSTTLAKTATKFNVSEEVMALGIALYVLGFGVGPMVFGPLSEAYGRTKPMFIGMVLFIIFQIPVAVAQNLQTLLVCRFLGGVWGSAPLAIIPGTYVDFMNPGQRGVAVACYAAAVFLGPALGPVVGGFVTESSSMGWRWTLWLTLIISAVTTAICVLTFPETFEAVLLTHKAKRLRAKTGNQALHSKREESPLNTKDVVFRYLTKPVLMFVNEPILIFMTLYIAVVYGLLYLSFEAFPISFVTHRHWSLGVAGLPFLSLGLGIGTACITLAIYGRTYYQRRLVARRGKIYPEDRLPPMILGSVVLPIGLFWFAWTSHPSIIWVPQVIGAFFVGLGIILIFLPGLSYIVDTYLLSANSANAINTFLRSTAAAGFTMFAGPMFDNLGVAWGASVLGFIAVALMPFPLLFWIHGEKIRKWSKFAIVM